MMSLCSFNAHWASNHVGEICMFFLMEFLFLKLTGWSLDGWSFVILLVSGFWIEWLVLSSGTDKSCSFGAMIEWLVLSFVTDGNDSKFKIITYRFVIIINVYLSHVVLAPKWCCFRTKMLQCYMLDNFNKCLKSVNHDAFAHQSSVVFAPKLDSIYVLEKFNKYFKSVNHDAFV